MKFDDHAPKTSRAGVRRDENIERIRNASTTAKTEHPDSDYFTRVLAEFLAYAEPRTDSWWRPAEDAEPGPDVDRVYNGTTYYLRVDNGWAPSDTADTTDKIQWRDIPATLLVDATQSVAGKFKIHLGHGVITIPDWQAPSPGEAMLLLENAIDIMRERVDAGVINGFHATRWTPSDGGPIILVRIPGFDDTDVTPSSNL